MKKKIVAVVITFLLGPGAGHLFIRKFKKGLFFILASLLFAVHFALQISKALVANPAAAQNPMQLLKEFSAANPKLVLMYDIVFAALWAYAIVDILLYYQEPPPAIPPQAE